MESAALLKWTVHVPVPLVMVKCEPMFEQEPVLVNATVPPGALASTSNDELYAALEGASVVTSIV